MTVIQAFIAGIGINAVWLSVKKPAGAAGCKRLEPLGRLSQVLLIGVIWDYGTHL